MNKNSSIKTNEQNKQNKTSTPLLQKKSKEELEEARGRLN